MSEIVAVPNQHLLTENKAGRWFIAPWLWSW